MNPCIAIDKTLQHRLENAGAMRRRAGFLAMDLKAVENDPTHAKEQINGLKTIGGLLKNVEATSAVLLLLTEYKENERALINSISLKEFSIAATSARACCDTLRKAEIIGRFSMRQEFSERITNLVKGALGQLAHGGNLDEVCALTRVLPFLNVQDEGVEFLSFYVEQILQEQSELENSKNSSVLERIAVKLSQALNLVSTCCRSMRSDFDEVSILGFVRNSCSQVAHLISKTVCDLVRVYEAEKIDEGNIGEIVMIGRACLVFWREVDIELRALVPLSKLDLHSYQDSSDELLLLYSSAEVRLLRMHYANAFNTQSKDGEVSCLYDVFYVFKRSCQRACTSTSAQTIIRILDEITGILEDMRLNIGCGQTIPLREFHLDSPDLGMPLLINNGIEEWINQPAVSRQNSIGLMCETVATLGATLLSEFRYQVRSCVANHEDLESLKECFQAMEAAIADFTKFSTETAVAVALDFIELMKPAINQLTLSNFVLSDAQFEKVDPNGSWVSAVLLSCEQLFKCCRQRFSCISEDWVLKLFENCIKRIVMVLELNMSNYLRFNQLGALLFERQIRALVLGLSCLAQQPCTRNKFSKILGACRILSLDDAGDIVDYLDASSGKILELNMNEVQEVLRLRVDFSEHAIQRVLGNLFVLNQ